MLIKNFGALFAMAFGVMVYNYHQGGGQRVLAGFGEGIKMFKGFFILMVFIFLFVGQFNILIKSNSLRFKELMSGQKGLALSALAGVASSSLAGGPIVKDLWASETFSNRIPILMFCITAMSTFNIQLLIIRAPMFGWQPTIIVGAIHLITSGICYAVLRAMIR